MKRPVELPKEPLEASKMLYNLTLVKPVLLKMQQNGKTYVPLIKLILVTDTEEKRPTGKAIQQQLGISAAVYRRWLDLLYADFMALIATDADVLRFPDIEHVFYVKGQEEIVEVRCRLTVTPRVGEEVELWFLSAFAREGTFYVSRVTHEYLQDKTLIHITLQPGYYDAYFAHLLARALFEDRWPREAWGMSDYQQKELLRKLYPG
ncbi:hypothetical protein [Hymenobacter profundi]|uniref:Uncharacterized protein n=1 Tax=Hymenobacter profundi TaxID=1982110 RepID=A0ABS6WWY1_9BACT|nr:hypothetical protein [Hymenobacter profundi]MBW3127288.1 hypothetical protein [Hymenobacter profundi]